MGFVDDLIRGATPAISGGMNIGMQGMAEMQRRKEEAEIQRRNAEQQAFMNMMRQRQFDVDQQQQAQEQENWQKEFDAQNFNNQQDDVYRDTQFRMGIENQLKQNNFEQQRIGLDKQRLAQGGNPKQGGFDQETAMRLAQKDAYEMAQTIDEYGEPTGQVDPMKFDQIVRQRHKFYMTYNPYEEQQLPKGGGQLIRDVFNGQPKQQNVAPMGVQGQPVTMSGGQAQSQIGRASILKQKFDANPSSLTPEEFEELGTYLNGGD